MTKTTRFSHLSTLLASGAAIAISVTGIGLVGCSSAMAAELPEQTADTNNAVEDIIVTARRREESAQKVPIAVTVVTQDALQKNNVQSLDDLQYLVPSMSINHSTLPSGDSLSVSIRGQGAGLANGGEGVVVFINEAPVPTIQNQFVGGPGMLFDLQNVQVLEGPQGTLFGRNSIGGDLLLTTARPGNQFGGHLQVSYGNYNDKEIDGAIDLPLIEDKLLARIAFNGQWRDGYTHLLGEPAHPNGIDADNRNTKSVRGTITFRPVDWLQNDTIVSYSQYNDRATAGILTAINPAGGLAITGIPPIIPGYPGLPALLPQQQALGIRTALPIDINDVSKGYVLMVNNNTRLSLGDNLTVRNIFSYSKLNYIVAVAGSGTVGQVFDNPSTPRERNVPQYTEELQLSGKSFGGTLDWVIGGFYMKQPVQPLSLFTVSVFGGVPLDSLQQDGQSSRAVYGQGTLDLSWLLPRLQFTGGVRYTADRKNHNQLGGNLFSVCTGQTPIGCGPDTRAVGSTKSNAVTYTLGLNYEVVPNTLLYLTDSRGYRQGGFNVNSLATGNPFPPFGPEYVNSYEFGVKSDWKIFGRPIRTNANIWLENYSEIQSLQGTSIDFFEGNVGKARLWGAELQAQLELTPQLQLGANFDYLHFNYTSFAPDAQGIPGLLATATLNRPPYKYSLNAHYHVPLSGSTGELSVSANWNWQSASGNKSLPGNLGMVPSFGLLNMSVGWEKIYGLPIDLSVFISNLLSKDYIVQPGYDFNYLQQGYAVVAYGEPRMYGIRLKFRFGAEVK